MNIDSMPAGREMDKLIAEKVLGQTDFSHPNFSDFKGNADGMDNICPNCHRSESHADEPCVKHYSTSWEDVKEVVDWVLEQGDVFLEYWSDGEWFVSVHPLLYSSREPYARDDGRSTEKLSLPLAVCRLALKMVT